MLFVSLVWPVPSAFITWIPSSLTQPVLHSSLEKAIFDPSGDQAGYLSSAALLVRSVWPVPSASSRRSRCCRNRMLLDLGVVSECLEGDLAVCAGEGSLGGNG